MEVDTIGSVVGDEGFHNVLNAICSRDTWILWCLKRLSAAQNVMISLTSD